MENKISTKNTLIVFLVLNLILNIFLILTSHKSTGFPLIIDINKVYQNFGDIIILIAVIQLFLDLGIFLFLKKRMKEKNEQIGKVGLFLWFVGCFTLVNNPLVNIGLLTATIKNLDIIKQKDNKKYEENTSNKIINKNSNTKPKTNIFERIINNFLVRPLLYKNNETFFKSTKMGRLFILFYITLFFVVLSLVILAPFLQESSYFPYFYIQIPYSFESHIFEYLLIVSIPYILIRLIIPMIVYLVIIFLKSVTNYITKG